MLSAGTLYVTLRGLTTGRMPCGDAVFAMEFDFVTDVLAIRHRDGRQRTVPLKAKPVAEFYGDTLPALDSPGIDTHIIAAPTRSASACSSSSESRPNSQSASSRRASDAIDVVNADSSCCR